MKKSKGRISRARKRRKLPHKKWKHKNNLTISEKVLFSVKERLIKYFTSFHKNFLKNVLIAGIIFLILLLINQLNFSWNKVLMEYIHFISKEGMDLSNVTSYLDRIYSLIN